MNAANKQLALYVGLALVGAYLLYRVTRGAVDAIAEPDVQEYGTSQGGLIKTAADVVLGADNFGGAVAQSITPLAGAHFAPGKASSSDPLAGITGGIFDPQNGGRVDRGTFGGTVRWRAEILNANSKPWSGVVKFDVAEDYLFGDTSGTVTKNVTIPARSALQLDIDYALRGGVHLREPDLLVNTFAGTKRIQADHSVVVT